MVSKDRAQKKESISKPGALDDEAQDEFYYIADDCNMGCSHQSFWIGEICSRAELRRATGPVCRDLLVWDDNKTNDCRGDIFAFSITREVHIIIKIGPPSDRLPSWNARMEDTQHEEAHASKKVVYLSKRLCVIDWDTWTTTLDGHKVVRGTQQVKRNLDNIRRYIQKEVNGSVASEQDSFVEGAAPIPHRVEIVDSRAAEDK